MFHEIQFRSIELIKTYHAIFYNEFERLTDTLRKKNIREFNNEEIDHSFDEIVSLYEKLRGKYLPIRTLADGNCLYYSILYNIEYKFQFKAFKSIRVAIIHILLKLC